MALPAPAPHRPAGQEARFLLFVLEAVEPLVAQFPLKGQMKLVVLGPEFPDRGSLWCSPGWREGSRL